MFLKDVIVKCPNDESNGEVWEVYESFLYHSDRYGYFIEVPKGFKSDLASVPKWLPIAWALYGGRGNKAAIVHDYIYHNKILRPYPLLDYQTAPGALSFKIDKDKCDLIFFDAMIECGVPKWRAYSMYQGVKLFGSKAYNQLSC